MSSFAKAKASSLPVSDPGWLQLVASLQNIKGFVWQVQVNGGVEILPVLKKNIIVTHCWEEIGLDSQAQPRQPSRHRPAMKLKLLEHYLLSNPCSKIKSFKLNKSLQLITWTDETNMKVLWSNETKATSTLTQPHMRFSSVSEIISDHTTNLKTHITWPVSYTGHMIYVPI